MKKAIIVVLLCLSGLVEMNAQVSFRPGIKAGLNLSHFTKGNFDNYNDNYYYEDYYYDYYDFAPARRNDRYRSKADFYIGLYGALKLTKYYTLQPEITYTRQGANKEFRFADRIIRERLDVSYISLGVANKFTFKKFNIHVGPTVDFVVDNNFDNDSDVDFAFFLGAGYNFTPNFAIEARIKKGIIPVLDYSDSNHTNVVFQTGITYTFDVK